MRGFPDRYCVALTVPCDENKGGHAITLSSAEDTAWLLANVLKMVLETLHQRRGLECSIGTYWLYVAAGHDAPDEGGLDYYGDDIYADLDDDPDDDTMPF